MLDLCSNIAPAPVNHKCDENNVSKKKTIIVSLMEHAVMKEQLKLYGWATIWKDGTKVVLPFKDKLLRTEFR